MDETQNTGGAIVKLKSVTIENYRAIENLELHLDPTLTVLHGANGHGKTSVLSAIAVGLEADELLGPYLYKLSIDFSEEDWREGAGLPRVLVESIDGITGERYGEEETEGREGAQRLISTRILDNELATNEDNIPIVAFYGTDRMLSNMPDWVLSQRGSQYRPTRRAALEGALSARTDFEGLLTWFYFKENEELRERRERHDFDYQLKDVSVIRQAITSMLPEISNPRIELNPLRFVVSQKSEEGRTEKLSLNQLSGGYRIVLALAADLARRMTQGNPHLDDPLQSEAIVLIDEIELHLHPAWQQRILADLLRTFPNAQFIVSTHSPQVLTTVEPQRIVELYRDGDSIVAEEAREEKATYGAEAGDVLAAVMRVNERPPNNKFTEALDQYRRLVSEGQGETKEALKLRRKLQKLSPRDYALISADLEIKQRKLFKQMAES